MQEPYEITSKNDNAIVDTTNQRITKVNQKINNVDKKLSGTYKKVKNLNGTLSNLEQRIDDVESKLNIIDSRLINVETSLEYNRHDIFDQIDTIKDNIKYSDNYIRDLTKAVSLLKIWLGISAGLFVISIISMVILFIT